MNALTSELDNILRPINMTPTHVGTASYVKLRKSIIAKLELDGVTSQTAKAAIKVTIINTEAGILDQNKIVFADIIGYGKTLALSNDEKWEWYPAPPSESEYERIRTELTDYFNVFAANA